MPSEREKMESWPIGAVFDAQSNSSPGTPTYVRASAEIQRRFMEIEQASLEAQRKAADAASDSAASARLSARYALGGIIIAIFSLMVSLATLYFK